MEELIKGAPDKPKLFEKGSAYLERLISNPAANEENIFFNKILIIGLIVNRLILGIGIQSICMEVSCNVDLKMCSLPLRRIIIINDDTK